jgi:phosphosulfolactate phosphohydrolase-like enzyme
LLGAQALSDEAPPYPKAVAEQLSTAIQYSADARPAILQSALNNQLALEDALFALKAQRRLERLERLTLHAVRALHYLEKMNTDNNSTSKSDEMDTSNLTIN